MPRWELAIPLTRSGQPFFLQVARAIAEAIRLGRLKPGDRLPGSRSLAASLELSRSTVLAAFDELLAEGWITSAQGSGMFVTRALPEPAVGVPASTRSAARAPVGYPLKKPPRAVLDPVLEPGTLRFGLGTPDVRLIPADALGRAYRRVIRAEGRRVLYYGPPHGHPRLRAALASMLSATRGLPVAADGVLITRGSQGALSVLAHGLLERGDLVAVEELGYSPAWEAFRLAGAELVPLPLDEEGVQVEAIERLAQRRPVRAVYVTPHHQHPTTVTLSPGRRLRLLEVARSARIAVIEDDYDHEFHYESRPILPMASADRFGVVIYVGSLSKILAPGLRIGYLAGPPPLIERLALHRTLLDTQGDLAVEAAVAELMEDGELLRHTRRARLIYEARRDALAAALREQLPGRLEFRVPTGGMAIWARARKDIDVERWARAALARGVAIETARRFTFDDRPQPFLRLGFSLLTEAELREGVRRLSKAATA